MQYRWVLQQLSSYENNYFDTTTAAAALLILAHLDPDKRISSTPLRSFSIKRISSELDKLYRMNFLRRRKTARKICVNGKSFNRGYKYSYRISSQGSKYVTWLRDGAMRKQRFPSDFNEELQLEATRQALPDSLKPYTYEIHFSLFNDPEARSIYKRFPIRTSKNNEDLIALLSRRITQLEEENSTLRELIVVLKK